MRNRRLAERLEFVQTLLRMYSEPPLNRCVDSPEIAGLIKRLECEEERLTARIAALGGEEPVRYEPRTV